MEIKHIFSVALHFMTEINDSLERERGGGRERERETDRQGTFG
jgi:hypothetical protein